MAKLTVETSYTENISEKLTYNIGDVNSIPSKLTDEVDKSPFILCFSHPLDKNYKISELGQRELKAFQKFLDTTSRMTYNQVEKLYKRKNDITDKIILKGTKFQVVHFGVTDKFRLHGVIADGMFHVIRFDPNHKKHSK